MGDLQDKVCIKYSRLELTGNGLSHGTCLIWELFYEIYLGYIGVIKF